MKKSYFFMAHAIVRRLSLWLVETNDHLKVEDCKNPQRSNSYHHLWIPNHVLHLYYFCTKPADDRVERNAVYLYICVMILIKIWLICVSIRILYYYYYHRPFDLSNQSIYDRNKWFEEVGNNLSRNFVRIFICIQKTRRNEE